MTDISYPTAPHSSLANVSNAITLIISHLSKVDYHFHRIASEITANYRNTFEQDLQHLFEALQVAREQSNTLITHLNQGNISADFWREAQFKLRTSISCIQGYAEIILENLTDLSQAFIYDLNIIIKTADQILPLSSQLRPTPSDLCEVEPSTTIFPSCFINNATEKSTILLIDQNAKRRALYERRFFYSNYELVQAETYHQALIIVNKGGIDLILLETSMEDNDSYDILLAFKYNPKTAGIPILIIASRNEMGKAAQYIRAGADDYILSPLNLTLFLARINLALTYRELLQKEIRYQEEILRLKEKI
jgi:CheY-like chemotaxis protein